MKNCNRELLRFFKEEVKLPVVEQNKMKKRQEDILNRLKSHVRKGKLPVPLQFKLQGSFPMRTMLKDSNSEYDIDFGAFFDSNALTNANGQVMNPHLVKQLVCNSLNGNQKNPRALVKENCVRVQFAKGYHVDIAVYCRFKENKRFIFKFASGSKWKVSNANKVPNWYERVFEDKTDREQYRRLTLYLKKFAKSRKSWKSNNLSGFAITVLLSEVAQFQPERDDIALYRSMCEICERIRKKTAIVHPLISGQTITSGEKVIDFGMRTEKAVDTLKPLLNQRCDSRTALECWNHVFNTVFFTSNL